MNSNCVINQNVNINNQYTQQLINLVLTGFSTLTGNTNTDNGKLYATFQKISTTYTLKVYKDIYLLDQVALGTSTTASSTVVNITAVNNSGITGTINFFQYIQDDLQIQLQCFLSVDNDLPLDFISGLTESDPVNGFVYYHLRAWEYVKDFLASKYQTVIYRKDFLDSNNLDNCTGGYDFSLVQNWLALREVSSHYAFIRICEKQALEKDSIWWTRYQESKKLLPALLNSTTVHFSPDFTRRSTKQRSVGVFKISRA
jgi:hypothetical protein